MADSFAYQNVDKIWIFSWHLKPPPVASALALVFRESENTDLTQPFAFSARAHLDIAKSPGIPGYPQSGINSCVKSSGFQFPIGRCVYDQTYSIHS